MNTNGIKFLATPMQDGDIFIIEHTILEANKPWYQRTECNGGLSISIMVLMIFFSLLKK